MLSAKSILATTALVLIVGEASAVTPPPPQDVLKPVSAVGAVFQSGGRYEFLRTSLLGYASQWGFVFMINRGLGDDIRGSNFQRWLRNISTLPEIPDGDGWLTNYIGHPLMGATFYALYRDRGFSPKESFAGAFLQSTLFEYTVEGWKQPPSGIDLIVTPVVGSLLGSQIGVKSFLFSSSYALGRYVFDLF